MGVRERDLGEGREANAAGVEGDLIVLGARMGNRIYHIISQILLSSSVV